MKDILRTINTCLSKYVNQIISSSIMESIRIYINPIFEIEKPTK